MCIHPDIAIFQWMIHPFRKHRHVQRKMINRRNCYLYALMILINDSVPVFLVWIQLTWNNQFKYSFIIRVNIYTDAIKVNQILSNWIPFYRKRESRIWALLFQICPHMFNYYTFNRGHLTINILILVFFVFNFKFSP